MQNERRLFFRSLQPLIGSVIGVGIFGLPFVFAQAGFAIGAAHLLIVGGANLVLLLLYADVIRNTDGHPRLAGIVRRFLGREWGWFGTAIMFGANWGSMAAYMIIGGEFLYALLSPFFGGALMVYQLVFYVVSAVLVLGGLGFIARLEGAFVLVLLLMLAVIITGSVPEVDLSHVTYVNPGKWFLPFGVVLFAFGGLAAVPEMAEMLGRHKTTLLRPAIVTGIAIVAVVYLAFAAVVTGVTGMATTDEGIIGLGHVVGDWALVLGSVIGLFSVFTSFLILALSNMDTMIYDYKRRHIHAWMIAVGFPLLIFLLGARNFISVIGFTGGVLGSLIGILVLYTYIKAKQDVCMPKRCLSVPDWVLFLTGCVFAVGVVLTFASL